MKNAATERVVDSVQIVKLIEIHFLRGEGVSDDPIRIVRGWWTLHGEKVTEIDPMPFPYREEAQP
jgi:hypothetical protein